MRDPRNNSALPGRFCVPILLAAATLLPASRCVATTYATWIMVWDSHTEKWWKPADSDGARAFVGGKWQAIDWADTAQTNEYLDDIKKAGIQVVIADLTNGWGWLNSRCVDIQGLCVQKDLKFCVAENSSGDVATFETHAHDIWDNFAGPAAPHPQTYLRYHGKPLIVCYGIRAWFNAYQQSAGPWRGKFNLVWSSGEDSNKDKWGWQLEPLVGSIPSKDSMFVTSSIKWKNSDATWRKSLAWLDYNFALAKRQKPDFIIVGSYDDIFERNSWLVADTAACIPGRQMRDPTGAISATAYYDRVRQWIRGQPSVVPGGRLKDGSYQMISVGTAQALSVHGSDGSSGEKLTMAGPGAGMEDHFWLYNLGHNRYRIIALTTGLSLSVPKGSSEDGLAIDQEWDDAVPWQTWDLTPAGHGEFTIRNASTGKLLCLTPDGSQVVQRPADGGKGQMWRMRAILTLLVHGCAPRLMDQAASSELSDSPVLPCPGCGACRPTPPPIWYPYTTGCS
jgi:hypothetical protein